LALISFDAALFLLGCWQCLQLIRPLHAGLGGEAAVQQSDAMWLVEPNDIAWIAATWPPMLAGASSLRDVIAFPKTTAARALFEDAPSAVPPEDLRELHLQKMTS